MARGELKQVRSPEKDLAARRAKRVAIKKELHGLVPVSSRAFSEKERGGVEGGNGVEGSHGLEEIE